MLNILHHEAISHVLVWWPFSVFSHLKETAWKSIVHICNCVTNNQMVTGKPQGDVWHYSKFYFERHMPGFDGTFTLEWNEMKCLLAKVDYAGPNQDKHMPKHMLTTLIILLSDHIHLIESWNNVWYVQKNRLALCNAYREWLILLFVTS